MSIDLNQLRVFVTVVETGAMTRAAKTLKMPISRVSRIINRLETALGTTLITRTTRQLRVSEAGKKLHQMSLPLIRRFGEIEHEFRVTETLVAGPVRITTPEDIGGSIVAPILGDLSTSHPALSLELICTDLRLDLVEEGVDIGLRMGKLHDSSLRAKKIGHTNMICVAGADYLQRLGMPRDPGELKNHECIHLTKGQNQNTLTWELYSGRQNVSLSIVPRLMCNHTRACLNFALAQRGIAMVPAPLAMDLMRAGTLTRVLPNWTGVVIPVHLIYPAQRVLAPRVKVVLDYLEDRLRPFF